MAKQIRTKAVASSNSKATIGFLNISVRRESGSLSKLGAVYIQNTAAGTAVVEYLNNGGDLEKVIDKLDFTFNPSNKNTSEYYEF